MTLHIDDEAMGIVIPAKAGIQRFPYFLRNIAK